MFLLIYWVLTGLALWLKPPIRADLGDFIASMLFGGLVFPALVLRKLL